MLCTGKEELARIEADVHSQETLIAGYQRENERLSDLLKGAREASRAEAVKAEEERGALALRLAELERTHSERAPEGLRDQLERAHHVAAELREAGVEREREMRYEIDRLRGTRRAGTWSSCCSIRTGNKSWCS